MRRLPARCEGGRSSATHVRDGRRRGRLRPSSYSTMAAERSEQLRRVGRSKLRVPQLGMGGGPLGGTMADADVQLTVKAAYDGGVRLFDTAPAYGIGRSERRLGVALNNFPRDQLLINSKVGKFIVPEPTLDAGTAERTHRRTVPGHDSTAASACRPLRLT
jgi:hypothetical protein